jgi:uncharacterized alkaline shock family protein YloU
VSLVIAGEAGSITVPDSTLLSIAVRAAEQVEGIRVLRRPSVDVEEGVVRLPVSARRGEPLLALGRAAQDEVAGALEAMCGITPRIEIAIGELA